MASEKWEVGLKREFPFLKYPTQVGEFHPIEEETEDEYPPGCYVGAGGEDLRFNWNFTNTYSYNYSAYPYYDYSMLCIEEPDQPNYHGKYCAVQKNRVAIQLAKIWLEFWLEKRLEIPF